MKDNNFIHETVNRFGDGLVDAMEAGTDTFSFEFDPADWPVDKPLIVPALAQVKEPMTLVVLIRPKSLADPMLDMMQRAREHMLAELAMRKTGSTEGQALPKVTPMLEEAKP